MRFFIRVCIFILKINPKYSFASVFCENSKTKQNKLPYEDFLRKYSQSRANCLTRILELVLISFFFQKK